MYLIYIVLLFIFGAISRARVCLQKQKDKQALTQSSSIWQIEVDMQRPNNYSLKVLYLL